jgi:hypothetical protein
VLANNGSLVVIPQHTRVNNITNINIAIIIFSHYWNKFNVYTRMTPLATFARDVMARKNENWADMTTTNSNHLHYSHDMSSTHSVILACSAATSPSSSSPPNSLEAFQSQLLAVTTSMQDVVKPASARDEIAEGPLCQFRKGFLDHLQPKQVVTSVRIL